MPYKIVIIACEGKTEERVVRDIIKQKKLSLEKIDVKEKYEISTEAVHPGIIDTWFSFNNNKYDVIVFLLDKDVEREVDKANSVKLQANKIGTKFIPVFQNPHMETFFACCFEEFSINEKLTMEELKINSENFLREKLKISKKNLKKITITKIIERGGNTKNALRYKDRFDILDLLK